MSIEDQGHFFAIYFLSFVCFVLYLTKISGERLHEHWFNNCDDKERIQKLVKVLNYEHNILTVIGYSKFIMARESKRTGYEICFILIYICIFICI